MKLGFVEEYFSKCNVNLNAIPVSITGYTYCDLQIAYSEGFKAAITHIQDHYILTLTDLDTLLKSVPKNR